MIAHYVKFISKVTQGIFMFLAVITSDALLKKCTSCTHDCEASLRKALSSYLHMQLVVIMWVATRFQYHYAFCLLIDTILESLHQLIFFSNLIWKGKIDWDTNNSLILIFAQNHFWPLVLSSQWSYPDMPNFQPKTTFLACIIGESP